MQKFKLVADVPATRLLTLSGTLSTNLALELFSVVNDADGGAGGAGASAGGPLQWWGSVDDIGGALRLTAWSKEPASSPRVAAPPSPLTARAAPNLHLQPPAGGAGGGPSPGSRLASSKAGPPPLEPTRSSPPPLDHGAGSGGCGGEENDSARAASVVEARVPPPFPRARPGSLPF